MSPMNRRDFLATSAATAAAVATGPIILGAEDKGGNKNPILGVEGHKYEVTTHAWGELPKDYSWQTTHNVAFDSEGNAYVTHQGVGKQMDVVLVFDPKGKFVRSFGKEFHGGGHGVEIRKEGSDEFCYLSNTWTKNELKVMKTDLNFSSSSRCTSGTTWLPERSLACTKVKPPNQARSTLRFTSASTAAA